MLKFQTDLYAIKSSSFASEGLVITLFPNRCFAFRSPASSDLYGKLFFYLGIFREYTVFLNLKA
jgi:hypothetical protein